MATPRDKRYETTSLVQVESLKVGREGVIAKLDGGWVLDRHHSAHPTEVPDHRPHRIVSIGFSGHYKFIEREMGWAPLGTAGENIIVDAEERVRHEDVARAFVIRTSAGDLEFDPPDVLNACVPFTRCLPRDQDAPPPRVQPALDFLGGGMRGYSMSASRVTDYATVRTGDLVLRKVAE